MSIIKKLFPHKTRGFSLVELMVVLGVILVLVGISLKVYSYVSRSALEGRIRAEIRILSAAIDQYKADNGVYPGILFTDWVYAASYIGTPVLSANGQGEYTSNGYWNSYKLYEALANPSTAPRQYMTFRSNQLVNLRTNNNGNNQLKFRTGAGVVITFPVGTFIYIIDPIGTPIGYNSWDPCRNPGTYDLWSMGMDGQSSYPYTNTGGAISTLGRSYSNDDIGNWTW